MRVAVVGSRNIIVNNLGEYLPLKVSEIVSGGAKGVDTSAVIYAKDNGIKIKEFFPDYKRFGKSAPLKRNVEIINYADMVIVFWDGASRGTRFVIEKCREMDKLLEVYRYDCEECVFRKHI